MALCLLAWPWSGPAAGQSGERRYTYKEFDGVYAFYKPSDPAKFRELLPRVFDMPDAPLVQVFVADYYKMDAATQPYLEAAVSLLASHQGQKAWHCILMPVTSDEARRLGVAFLGFPKVLGEITLERGHAEYTGALKLGGAPVMSVRLKTEGHVVTAREKQWFQDLAGIPSLNILNGKVIDPMAGGPRGRLSMLDLSAMFPEKIEVKAGKAEISLKPGAAAGDSKAPARAFDLQPSEIVLAYYLKNKLGFRFGPRPRQEESGK